MKLNIAQQSVEITSYLILDIAENLDLYKKGELHYDWLKGKIVSRNNINYEEKLLSFLQAKHSSRPKLNDKILIIMGGIGTGKTSTMEYVISNLLEKKIDCNQFEDKLKCESKPTVLKLDFEAIDDELEENDATQAFWALISTIIDENTQEQIKPEEEITKFWLWCLKQKSLMQKSEYLHRELNALSHHIKHALDYKPYWGSSPEKLMEMLIASRVELFRNMNPSDLAYYKLFLLKYISFYKNKDKCNCFFVFVDNVDQLDPKLQIAATQFSVFLSSTLNSKTIVTIRPLTWARSIHSHVLIRTQNHYSPDIINVIESRFNKYIEENNIPVELKSALKALTNIIIGKSKHRFLPKLLRATSGISLRFALRNYGNMLESQLLTDLEHSSNSDIPFRNLRVSDIVRAYFFGNRDTFIRHAYTNLYSIDQDNRIEYSLIKPRILDYLIRIKKGSTKVINLVSFLKLFNYDDKAINNALVELMKRLRPLIWCEDGFKKINFQSHANIAVTPIGHGYYNELLGEYYYDEVCLAKSLRDKVFVDKVYTFHIDITQQDFDEINYFTNENGSDLYLHYYPSSIFSISLLHWNRFKIGLNNRAKKENKNFDFERDNYIKETISKILLNNGV